ncbi:hypothetical protein PISMIDRAFT_686784 [Pisolithus microcarpus 441]|uniref:Uncharacterized protein n=1 Tax=Pisolithus microcarpus 441 TaxID=765257 RepID=A0A0C9Z1B4_9AGAM|nr:hypothetical protein PISMIDRAFT_686784 [Pisolithus microcarpus 441]
MRSRVPTGIVHSSDRLMATPAHTDLNQVPVPWRRGVAHTCATAIERPRKNAKSYAQ